MSRFTFAAAAVVVASFATGCADLTRSEPIRIRKDPPPAPIEPVAAEPEPAAASELPGAPNIMQMPPRRPGQKAGGTG